MANILDYLDWYGDLDLATVPFGEADNLILCQLSYLHLDEAVPASTDPADAVDMKKAASLFADSLEARLPLLLEPASASAEDRGEQGLVDPDLKKTADRLHDLGPLISPKTRELPRLMAERGRRFGDLKLFGFVSILDEDEVEQFAAVSALLPDGSVYVAFRGTDKSVVGWIEDTMISYTVVPAQKRALAYLEEVAAKTTGPLRVGGHSKGGNLAVYAAAHASPAVQDRIREIWDNDGPGFEDQVVPPSDFDAIRDRIHLFTPEYSVVASLLSQPTEAVIIRSDGDGVMEHSAIDWQVMRTDFVRGGHVRTSSRHAVKPLQGLLLSHGLMGRQKLIEGLFQTMRASQVKTIGDVARMGAVNFRSMMDSIGTIDEADRKTLSGLIWQLASGTVAGAAVEAAEATAAAVGPLAKQLSSSVGSALSRAGTNARATLEAGFRPGGRDAEAADEQDADAEGERGVEVAVENGDEGGGRGGDVPNRTSH